MNCPACRAELHAGQERCPACGTMVAPAVIGALAPDPARQTPPSRGKGAVRDMAGLRKAKGPSWQDEVRDRVQKRRRRRAEGGDLPLFDAPVTAPPAEPEPEPAPTLEPTAMELASPPLLAEEPEPDLPIAGPVQLGDEAPAAEAEPAARVELGAPRVDEDWPLRPEPAAQVQEAVPEMEPAASEAEEDQEAWLPREEPARLRPVERPAAFGDRVEAAVVDAGVLFLLDVVVIYFAGRAAQAELGVLLRHWPWLSAFLAFLGLSYAAWFTGTTGQTPGKMLVGLRVVEGDGGPPGYPRAFLRAALGALGSALLGLGVLPLFFDPARRTLHDRLLRTRVVKF